MNIKRLITVFVLFAIVVTAGVAFASVDNVDNAYVLEGGVNSTSGFTGLRQTNFTGNYGYDVIVTVYSNNPSLSDGEAVNITVSPCEGVDTGWISSGAGSWNTDTCVFNGTFASDGKVEAGLKFFPLSGLGQTVVYDVTASVLVDDWHDSAWVEVTNKTEDPTPTNTPVPPTDTATSVPPTATSTAYPLLTPTNTPPPTATSEAATVTPTATPDEGIQPNECPLVLEGSINQESGPSPLIEEPILVEDGYHIIVTLNPCENGFETDVPLSVRIYGKHAYEWLIEKPEDVLASLVTDDGVFYWEIGYEDPSQLEGILEIVFNVPMFYGQDHITVIAQHGDLRRTIGPVELFNGNNKILLPIIISQ